MMSFRAGKILSGCVLLSLLTPGYAADKFPEFPLRAASDYSVFVQQDDVMIGLQPVENINDQQTYFRTEFSRKGFVPVFLVIHNGSKSESVLFDKSKISCDLQNSSNTMPKAGIKGAASAEIFDMAAVPFGPVSVIAAPLVLELYADASHVQQNLLLKEVQSQTISPGESAHGFLYISIPKKGVRQKIDIHIPISWAGSDRTSTLSLSF